MNRYYVYILLCSDKSYYIGVTNNMERRLNEHNEGEDEESYTYSRRPFQMVYFEYFIEVNQAIQREKQLKGWSRAKKKALIDENWDKLVRLSKNYSQFTKLDD
jgi:putative endonuclease